MGRQTLGWVVPVLLTTLCLPVQGAQICRDHIRATAPNSRYQDNGDGTVTDLSTALLWKQCPEGLSGAGCTIGQVTAFTWPQALRHAQAAEFAGSSLWRLPNKNELASLVERRCFDPSINATLFPNTPSESFLSSSPDAYYPDSVWEVRFYDGIVGIFHSYSYGYVRLVRARR